MIEGFPYAIALCGAGSTFLIVLSTFPAESPVSARLKKMERVTERSVLGRATIIQQIVSKERQSRMQTRLLEAGWYRVTPLAMILRSLGALGLGAALGLALVLMLSKNDWLGIAVAAFSALVAWRIPNIVLDRAIKARKEDVQRELPNFLDLMAATVQAGLALNAALVQATDAARGALKEELQSMLAEVRLGRSRADAFNAMADRLNEDSTTVMVTAIVQSERLGSNLSQVLLELAKETRDRRWIRAEERASQLPVKMVLPMALFMIPSLYLMIFGPVLARVVLNR